MSRDWEGVFTTWSQSPSQTERDKCDNAERALRNAVAASTILSAKSVSAFAQGSYCNRTNVRADSDVDICVLCKGSVFYDVPPGMSAADFGLTTPASYSYEVYRNDVEAALVDHFGRAAVLAGNKAFDIHENTYRISADAVACFEYRQYSVDGTWLPGTAFLPRSGGRVVNWPQQNYDNGVAKNDRTGRRFKGVVRIMKHLRNEMREAHIASAESVPSFLNECLVQNVPDEGFGHDSLAADVQFAIAHLFNDTLTDSPCAEWLEVNAIKPLFEPAQPWTRAGVNQFLRDAWNYVGFR